MDSFYDSNTRLSQEDTALELRPLNDDDVPLMEIWLNKGHVKKWYWH